MNLPKYLVVVVFLGANAAYSASFDCRKARTDAENLICGSKTLAALDDKLHFEYVKALSLACDAATLKKDQLTWLKTRNAAHAETPMAKSYRGRIDALSGRNATQTVHYEVINSTLGRWQFFLETIGCHEYRRYHSQRYELVIRDQTGQSTQHIQVESSSLPKDVLSFVDMDGDSHRDMVINRGYGAGPFPNVQLYRYNSNTRLFERDADFPVGEVSITPSEERGCVYVEERQPTGAGYDYTATRWCFKPQDGRWSERERCSAQEDKECFDQISEYVRKWHEKQARDKE